MSSDEDFTNLDNAQSADSRKKRKVLRACDTCRRMRIRCDALTGHGAPCSHCVASKSECTFLARAPKRYPAKGFIDDIQKRCEALEALVLELDPTLNLEEEIGPQFSQETWQSVRDSMEGPLVKPRRTSGLSRTSTRTSPSTTILTGRRDTRSSSASDEDSTSFVMGDLESRLEKLSLSHLQERYHRNCSGIALLEAAMSLKKEVVGDSNGPDGHFAPQEHNHWEFVVTERTDPSSFNYPPEDLADELTDKAFRYTLLLYPVVHRQSFDIKRKAKAYLEDLDFAQIYLMVCALGSRFTTDDRVFIRNEKGQVERESAGWPYFSQVSNLRRPIIVASKLPELQVKAMMCVYLLGTSAPHAAWMLASAALHAAEDVHRERLDGPRDAFEDQMWRRVFWSLVAIDRMSSAGLTRPVIAFDDEVAADKPLLVDDEYWDPVTKEWNQPTDKPSRMEAFVQITQLYGILGHGNRVLRKLSLAPKPHNIEEQVNLVAGLDSELNAWLNSLPDHLKWDAEIEDDQFFDEASQLRLMYHFVQINIHRPFIPALATYGAIGRLPLPSMSICVNASRCTGRILEAYGRRGFIGHPMIHAMGFIAATILLIHMWESKKINPRTDLSNHIEDVQRCFYFMRTIEKTCATAGRFFDILRDLASIGDVHVLPPPSLTALNGTRKRRRDGTQPRPPNNSNYGRSLAQPSTVVPQSMPPPTLFELSTNAVIGSNSQQFAAQASYNTSPPSSGPQLPLPPQYSELDQLAWTGLRLPESSGVPQDLPYMGAGYHPELFTDAFLRDFMAGFGADSTQLMPHPGYEMTDIWNGQPTNDWSWLNEVLTTPATSSNDTFTPPQT